MRTRRSRTTISCSAPAPGLRSRPERPPVVPRHHQGGRDRGRLDSQRAASLVPINPQRQGVTIEEIADLVGHKTTVVTRKVYRYQLKPVITTGATMMNSILDRQKGATSA